VADIDGLVIPRPAAAAAEQMIERARAAGVRDGDPDGLLVASMASTAIALDESVADLLERLNSTDESFFERLERRIRHVAGDAVKDAAKAIVVSKPWRTAVIAAGMVALAAIAGICVGWDAGYTTASQRTAWTAAELQAAFRGGLPGAEWLATVAKLNDLEGLAGSCRDHQWSAVGGGKGCTVQVRVSAASVGEKR
jgi:hypothetical protein